MRTREISGTVGRIAVVALFVLAVALWALGQYSPQSPAAPQTPDRRPLGNAKLLSHTITTNATLTFVQTNAAQHNAKFTVTLTASPSNDPDASQCTSGRSVTVTRIAGGALTLTTNETSPGVYETNNGNNRAGTWRASVTQKTFTGYGGQTHTCSSATSNTVSVP